VVVGGGWPRQRPGTRHRRHRQQHPLPPPPGAGGPGSAATLAWRARRTPGRRRRRRCRARIRGPRQRGHAGVAGQADARAAPAATVPGQDQGCARAARSG